MPVLRALARPMLASIFIIQGYDTFRRPERVAAKAEPVVRPLAERVPAVPAKTEQAVKVNGAVQMVAGGLLALGKFPRLSALAIAGTLIPTTLAGHRFWEEEEETSLAQQRIHFLKNLSMFGGLLIAAADTAGKPSLAWRSRYAAKARRREAALVARAAKASSAAATKAGLAAGKSGALTGKAGLLAGKAGAVASRSGTAAGKAGAKAAAKTAKVRAKAAAKAAKASAKAGKSGGKLAGQAKAARGAAKLARPGAKAGAKAARPGTKLARSGGKATAKAGKLRGMVAS